MGQNSLSAASKSERSLPVTLVSFEPALISVNKNRAEQHRAKWEPGTKGPLSDVSCEVLRCDATQRKQDEMRSFQRGQIFRT